MFAGLTLSFSHKMNDVSLFLTQLRGCNKPVTALECSARGINEARDYFHRTRGGRVEVSSHVSVVWRLKLHLLSRAEVSPGLAAGRQALDVRDGMVGHS